MISAAGKLVRAGRELLRARARYHHRTGRYVASVLDGLIASHVDDRRRRGEHHVRPEDGLLADQDSFHDDGSRADERAVLDHHRGSLRRFENAADPDPSRQVNIRADLGTGPDGCPGVDHRPRPDPGADVDVARHQHDPFREVGAVPRHRGWYDTDAQRRDDPLERHLVEIRERTYLDRLGLPETEGEQDRLLHPLVRGPCALTLLGNTHAASIEEIDDLAHRVSTLHRVLGRELPESARSCAPDHGRRSQNLLEDARSCPTLLLGRDERKADVALARGTEVGARGHHQSVLEEPESERFRRVAVS